MERIKALLHTAVIIVIYFLADAFSIEALSFVFVKSGSFLLGEIVSICLGISSIIFAVYLYSRFVLKKTFSEIYLGRPLPSVRWSVIAFLMPITIVMFYIVFTKGAFYRENLIGEDIAYAVCDTIAGAGLIWL